MNGGEDVLISFHVPTSNGSKASLGEGVTVEYIGRTDIQDVLMSAHFTLSAIGSMHALRKGRCIVCVQCYNWSL